MQAEASAETLIRNANAEVITEYHLSKIHSKLKDALDIGGKCKEWAEVFLAGTADQEMRLTRVFETILKTSPVQDTLKNWLSDVEEYFLFTTLTRLSDALAELSEPGYQQLVPWFTEMPHPKYISLAFPELSAVLTSEIKQLCGFYKPLQGIESVVLKAVLDYVKPVPPGIDFRYCHDTILYNLWRWALRENGYDSMEYLSGLDVHSYAFGASQNDVSLVELDFVAKEHAVTIGTAKLKRHGNNARILELAYLEKLEHVGIVDSFATGLGYQGLFVGEVKDQNMKNLLRKVGGQNGRGTRNND